MEYISQLAGALIGFGTRSSASPDTEGARPDVPSVVCSPDGSSTQPQHKKVTNPDPSCSTSAREPSPPLHVPKLPLFPPLPLSKPPSDPAAFVLSGQQLIVSYDGTSDSVQGGGTSACGLAALNCARVVLGKSKQGSLGTRLLEEIIDEKTMQDIVSICPMWTGNANLEIDEIVSLPMFNNFLKPLGISWGKATRSGFDKMLTRLQDLHQHSVVVTVITKVHEIVACIRVAIQDHNVFVIYDPHARPSHPNGAGFIIDADKERILDHLTMLMGVDEDLLNDPDFAWQMEMLSTFSGHCFIPEPEDPDLESLIIKLSIQSYGQHTCDHDDSAAEIKLIKEERDRFLSRLKQWRGYAEAQTSAVKAYKQEVEKVERQALRDKEALTQEIEELRRQVQQAGEGRVQPNAQNRDVDEEVRAVLVVPEGILVEID
ncbi:hypothetical protein BDN72DRAFT_900702 [Pluteus cervinus]|uniref:Uncharacterized protein n=1 Tax=Pluteus cervinus TaxID=181527 RepID=A0ACD3AKK6_9AGAR|nr:hypothetical protein BDN72DRAFT_900702 [Pluteus cervinus]